MSSGRRKVETVFGREFLSLEVSPKLIAASAVSQQAGFTLEEIKTMFHGFGAETPLSARWHSLARAKLHELDALAERIRQMRGSLEACYLGWQESLEHLARLVEPEIPD